MSLVNEYELLLQYLEEQPKKKVTVPQQKEKIEVASKTTKKLIEEATIDNFKDIPSHVPFSQSQSKSSKGFDVNKFETMMRTKLIEKYKTTQTYERPYISASELFNCLRQAYYARKKYQIDVSGQFRFSYLYLIQKVGDTIHQLFQELYDFSEVEKTIVSEIYHVKGRVDCIKDKNIYEIKSIDENKLIESYKKEHYLQGLIYAYILNKEYDYKIDTITIIYVLRNLKRINSIDVEYNENIAINLLKRGPLLIEALESNKIIDPIGSTKEQCGFCPYKSYCEKDQYKQIKPAFINKSIENKKEENKPVFLL